MGDLCEQMPVKQSIGLPGMFQRYGTQLDRELHAGLSRTDSSVYDMLRYYMGWVDTDGKPCVATQGKLLRPTLCLMACEAVGGQVDEAMPAAVALEFIHNFSLIHDDIQDRDETRHHRPTLWAVWGIPKALVAGNVLRVVADSMLERLAEHNLRTHRALSSVSLLTEAYLQMIEGQYLDLSFEGRPDIGMNAYLRMISRKTGALIRCALNMGAAIGSTDETTVGAFRSFGRSIGYAFQIRDDYLGVWGDEDTTGKPVGADVRRKKNSFPVVHAMSEATGSDKEFLLEIYQKDELTDDDVDNVLNVMDRVRTKSIAQALTATHCDEAVSTLASVELDPDTRREVEELVKFLLVREH